ncbi:MAG: BON domain-containing protein [Spirochaetaceae bacterium]|nr:MAG: BON domain-containing protein [Spirochaetaceae bacterium]
MNVITCSRQSGSRGEEIIDLLSRELNVQVVDKDSVEHALVKNGLPERSFERYDEKKPGFWDLISSDRERYFHCLKASILEIAQGGNSIIVGRGAPVLLAGVPGVLHLRIVAPLETRIHRVMEAHSCGEADARRLIRESDHNRAGFYRYFFDSDWDSHDLYDLILNTGYLKTRHALEIVRSLLKTPEFQENAATTRRLTELSLAQRILKQILVDEQIPIRFPAVEVSGGTATLTGTVNVAASIERCKAVAENTEGITEVLVQILHAPEIYNGPFM